MQQIFIGLHGMHERLAADGFGRRSFVSYWAIKPQKAESKHQKASINVHISTSYNNVAGIGALIEFYVPHAT